MSRSKLERILKVISETEGWFNPELISAKTDIPVREVVHIIRVYCDGVVERRRNFSNRHSQYRKIVE